MKNKLPQSMDIADKVEVTGAVILKKLRDAVAPPGKKGTWLRLLSDDRLAEVYHRLRLGQSVYHIVKVAQNEWGIQRNSENKSLARAVKSFKNKVIGAIQKDVQATASKERKEFRKRLSDRTQRKFDALLELEWVIALQKERIILLAEREQIAKIPLKMTDKAIKIYGELVEKHVRMEAELGLRRITPSELHVQVKAGMQDVLDDLPPGGSAAMVRATDRFLKAIKAKAITLERGPDGKWKRKKVGDDDGETREGGGTPDNNDG